MDPRDWLLLFVSFEGAPEGLDPVRVQKGLFLFAKEAGTAPPREKYAFVPFNYGPMSKAIYTDLDQLVKTGLVEEVPVKGQTWCRYRPTNRGIEHSHKLLSAADHQAAEDLFNVKQSVATMTFESLLQDVYDRYPDYAVNSVFQRRR